MSTETETPAATRRRGLGPFSGAQLTVIIVTFAVLLLAPVGAWAVAGSNVFVTDAGTGQRAFVSGAGQVNVTRAGAKSYFVRAKSVTTTARTVLATPTSGHALVVTSINVDVYKALNPGFTNGIIVAVSLGDASCNGLSLQNGLPYLRVNPSAIGLTVIPFDPGIVVPAGRALCAQNSGAPTDVLAEIYTNGYSIPAAAAPPGA